MAEPCFAWTPGAHWHFRASDRRSWGYAYGPSVIMPAHLLQVRQRTSAPRVFELGWRDSTGAVARGDKPSRECFHGAAGRTGTRWSADSFLTENIDVREAAVAGFAARRAYLARGVRVVEIKAIGGDGMYTFAIVADANARRRYRVRRRTGAIEVFDGYVASTWRRPTRATAEGVKRAIAAAVGRRSSAPRFRSH